MKKIRLISALLVVVCLLLQLQQTTKASTGTVSVLYMPDAKYTLIVDVRGNGKIIDGSQSIHNGIVQYDFLTTTEKQFYIQPDTGYQIKRLDYERDNEIVSLLSQLVNNLISIQVEEDISTLYIEFEKNSIPNQPGDMDTPTNPEVGPSGPGVETGDKTHFEYIWVMLISIGGFIYIYTKDKSRKELCRDTYNR